MLVGLENKIFPGVITLEESRLETYDTGTRRPKLQVTVDVSQFSGQSPAVNLKYQTGHFFFTLPSSSARFIHYDPMSI